MIRGVIYVVQYCMNHLVQYDGMIMVLWCSYIRYELEYGFNSISLWYNIWYNMVWYNMLHATWLNTMRNLVWYVIEWSAMVQYGKG